MNGVHDMGGMHGLGPIEYERNEPVFHQRWEARALALTLAMGAWGKWNIDATRHARELIPGPEYLRMSYYEKWLTALVDLSIEHGLVTRGELETGRPARGSKRETPMLTADIVARVLAKGGPARRDLPIAPRFEIGQHVRAKNINPTGHTRLPR